MKKILSASICAIAMAAAVPALAADKPVHHHHAHHGKGMMGPHTKPKPAGSPSTEELNAKSLDAARGGAAPAAPDAAAPAAPAAPASSGSTGTMTPSNAPGGN
ncbi:hypothetical protein NFI95_02550 [Acetobacteraceae bacterium KSS8]|uniref:Uncharacterized protein n=1 Tax=Endosaccharibacter trunci TaxID=2812733 RepID=A0ABT1W379_9PROT|nr:hypothetical protein [Acetobacteraceae bacterium KSS8]